MNNHSTRGEALDQGSVIVVDVGKTLSKITLWSRSGDKLDCEVRPNEPSVLEGVRRLDLEGIGDWLITALSSYADEDVRAIVPVGHGAGVVAINDSGPAFAPLDYEQAIPAEVTSGYRAERDDFAETGSPLLPDGLNLGAQLFWLDQMYPNAMPKCRLVPWAQYWAWFLTGIAASEVTSLGCHSDLWSPRSQDYSPMARRLGWADRFAPLVKASDVVGMLRPEIAAATGLSPSVEVLAGLHDSNAALMAARGFDEIAGKDATVLSTGTWFVAMRHTAANHDLTRLPANRDCLINVSPTGEPVPSARFMGGREIETVVEIDARRVDIPADQTALLAAVTRMLAAGAMLLPTLARGSGPFPDLAGCWTQKPMDWDERRVAACLYAALVASTSLGLIGSQNALLVEGRFAKAEVFVRALAALRPDMHVFTANEDVDVSFGALRLIDPGLKPRGGLRRSMPLQADLAGYRSAWLSALGETE